MFQSLSDSILSRFSVFCVGEHENEENEKIIKICAKCKNISEIKTNSIISKFRNGELKNIKKIKNFINILSKMNKNNSLNSFAEVNLNNYKNDIRSKIIDKNYNYIMNYIQLNNKNEDIELEFKKGQNVLEYKNSYVSSIASGLKISIDFKPDLKTDKKFTPLFNKLIDLIHFSICTSTSLILEGNPGQGKQTAINYVCKILNFEVENIIITQSLSVKDLFKKTIIETKEKSIELFEITSQLYNILNKKNINKNGNEAKKIMFVFHGINNAESDVLMEISKIFNEIDDNIPNYFLIGIININESLVSREEYYYNLFSNSIYYKVDSLNYLNTGLIINQNINTFSKYYHNKNDENIYTLSDISKFNKLKKETMLDDEILEDIIFKNKKLAFNNDSKIYGNNLNTYINKYDFGYKNNTTEFFMKVNDKSFSLEVSKSNQSNLSDNSFLPISEEMQKYFEKEKNTLSFEQIKCFIFLGLAVKSKMACIVQGPSGVGKSHLIKLFAKFLGKKLHIFELNKDNQISLLTKCYIFNNYSKEEKEDIQTYLDKIYKIPNEKKMSMDERFAEILKIDNLDENKKKLLNELKSKYSLTNRFEYKKSEFLEVVKNGEWILLDGIENSPSFIAEKIAFLCGDKPELNLYEKDEPIITPEEGFHLFITYNPEIIYHNNTLPSSLLDKCLVYNLRSFINDRESISQIIHGFLSNLNFTTNEELIYDVSSRLSNIHKLIENKNISERNIINFCKTLNIKKIESSIKENYLYYYFPSIAQNEREKYIKIINENINKLGIKFNCLASTFQTKCKEPIYLLSKFEEYIKEQNGYKLFFIKFLSSFLDTPFKYINNLRSSILEKINSQPKIDNIKDFYSIFKIFIEICNEINNSFQRQNEKNFNDTKIRDNISFDCIKKFIIYEELNKKNLFSFGWMNLLYEKSNIFNIIENLHKNHDLESLNNFFKALTENINFIQDITKIFPYSKFKDTNFSALNSILKFIVEKASIKNINFQIKLDKTIYNFKFIEKNNDIIYLVLDLELDDKNKIIITQKTEINGINFDKLAIKFNKHQINNFNLKFLEQIFSSKIIKASNMNKYMKNAKLMIDEDIIVNTDNYSLSLFLKEYNNVLINSWSILFINNNKFIDNYLPYFLNGGNNNFENNIFCLIYEFYKTFNHIKENKTFNDVKENVLKISEQISQIINKENYLYKLIMDKDCINNMNLQNSNEIEEVINRINKELNIVENINENINIVENIIKNIKKVENKNENFKINPNRFKEYKDLLKRELERLNIQNNKLRIENYKKFIIKKLEKSIKEEKIIEGLKEKINKIESNEELNEYDELIDNYMIKYKKTETNINDSMIFSKDTIQIDDINNKNVKLIELLLKYFRIKNFVEEIKKSKDNKLLSLTKLFELIDKNYFDLFMTVFLENIDNTNIVINLDDNEILESSLLSMLAKDIVDNELIETFIEFPNLLNNLYNLENHEKIDINWCWNIEKRYKFNTPIYIPELNNLSFLYIFIRKKTFKSNEFLKGDLIKEFEKPELINGKWIEDDKISKMLQNKFNDFNNLRDKNPLEKLILDIGNIIISDNDKYKDIKSLSKRILEKLKSCSEKKKILLSHFLKYKNLYLKIINKNNEEKIINNEKLYFYDLNFDAKKKGKIFTNIYPSLINFLNHNSHIYNKLIKEDSILNFLQNKDEIQYIPLWLLCLRVLANSGNINVEFKTIDEETCKLELELKETIIQNINNNNNLDWVLLISPNNTNLIENEYCERFYIFFNYLLISLSNFSERNRKKLFIYIKEFIFDVFNKTFSKGIDNVLRSDENIFLISEKLSQELEKITEKEFHKFINGDNYNNLILKRLKNLKFYIMKN